MFKCHRLNAYNQQVPDGADYERAAPVVSQIGEVHMLIIALDYKGTEYYLTATSDAKNMVELARACQVQDIVTLYDGQCTRANVLQAIEEVGGRCGPDDYFVFYYAGHGVQTEDLSGDEEDGLDEAFLLVDGRGRFHKGTLLIDDDFALALREAMDPNVRILVLTDCCHSGTIADLDSDHDWRDYDAMSIAATLDEQEAEEHSKEGGIFTHSLLLAISKLQQKGEYDYSVGRLFNKTLWRHAKVFQTRQDMQIQSSRNDFSEMAWPLVPVVPYTAPLQKASRGLTSLLPSKILAIANLKRVDEEAEPEEDEVHTHITPLRRGLRRGGDEDDGPRCLIM